jgi:hypothetical protein
MKWNIFIIVCVGAYLAHSDHVYGGGGGLFGGGAPSLSLPSVSDLGGSISGGFKGVANYARKEGGNAARYVKTEGGNAATYGKKEGGNAARYVKKEGGNAASYLKQEGRKVAKSDPAHSPWAPGNWSKDAINYLTPRLPHRHPRPIIVNKLPPPAKDKHPKPKRPRAGKKPPPAGNNGTSGDDIGQDETPGSYAGSDTSDPDGSGSYGDVALTAWQGPIVSGHGSRNGGGAYRTKGSDESASPLRGAGTLFLTESNRHYASRWTDLSHIVQRSTHRLQVSGESDPRRLAPPQR